MATPSAERPRVRLVLTTPTRPPAASPARQFRLQHPWVGQDRRLSVQQLVTLSRDPLKTSTWRRGLEELKDGQLSGLLWLREDVRVDDFLLLDHLLSLPKANWVIHDAAGQPAVRIALQGDAHWQYLDGSTLPLSLSVDMGEGQRQPLTRAGCTAPLVLVVASTCPARDFSTDTALGRSVKALRASGMKVRLVARCSNQRPLGTIYNAEIHPRWAGHIMVFVHDDVSLYDWHLAARLDEALHHFDLVGVAGCRKALPVQPGWMFPQELGRRLAGFELLGTVGHDTLTRNRAGRKLRKLSRYGEARGAASLLDGVFLAARVDTLLRRNLRFDPRFPFHFYDLDLCYSALALGLQPGVWPICLTHHSGGAFNTPEWERRYADYRLKWMSR